MLKAVSVLFGAGITVASAWALGRVALRRLGIRLHREEEHVIGLVLGSALLSLAIFALAAARLVYDATLVALAAGALALAWRSGAMRSSPETLPAVPRGWMAAFVAVYTPFAVIALMHAMAPEISPDGSSYHIGVMARFYREHGFIAMPWHMYAQLSQGFDLLFIMAFALGRQSATAVVHCVFLLALPWMLLRFGQRTGHPAAGAVAGLLVFASPVVMVDGASAYNDVALAAVLFALFYLCEVALSGWQRGLAAALGLLAGYAFGVKYTAAVALPFAFVMLIVALRRAREAWLRPVLVFCGCAALMVLPWLVRNGVQYGNPVAPMFNRLFPNPVIHVSFEEGYRRDMQNYVGLKSRLDLPLELTVRGQTLQGFMGPVFLLAPLGLLALRLPLGRRALLAALWFAIPYVFNIGTRFLIPAMPFIALSMTLAFPARAARFVLPLLLVAHSVTSWPRIQRKYCDPYAWRIARVPWKQALRVESAEKWLAREVIPYRTAYMLESNTPVGSATLAFESIMQAYTNREVRVMYQSARGERLFDAMAVAVFADQQPVLSREFTFPARKLREVRIVQTGTSAETIWSVSEIRIFNGERELPRDPRWRITARPFPWDIPYAFDNSPLTRWRSWETIHPGMFIDVDFGEPTQISEVRVEMPSQHDVKLRLESAGVALDATEVTRGLPPPLGLRRAVVEEMKREGISFLLVTDGQFWWEEFHDRASLWGIHEIAKAGNDRLYRLE